ncbi:1,4-dihydroxy-2-naphtoate prenyltransferase [Rhodospirillum rubrum F11]|uniref:1,4-dihydroxy-2-naphthoate octaprenyltransferase n=3 Tax=Rhodospirillum rubrum TaxID=1085 RepID=Q2RNW3_RHORT|nr:1,4-dihydroxy-2-naphthoate octaprenyltransferase [Rhodospirillum rubrum]ABC24182.1 1,4-Dihydroxy-2-naphtoate prenyltransferase [Rhodospirillum rubrum ATCC 11170]AEO49933.1 1,4-dihydroxy-2-naphtoate prenyltransferase [Rhodospirillum rubrum F11]MBK5955895.1 1,4-dihydroxy-2-naphthoate octaprenyltransferase [Rhodospirillum rubrum]QXG80119.1 1,4-dihydroxy-2-naphthoate octaprenyltransferase [Rhodospirillum rubrum]HCF17719.1 1,4-dihydroxy-2-naphthoate octaprenyltransferase [Rhodospirillum rubrum]
MKDDRPPPTPQRPPSPLVWWAAARPRTLGLSLAPVLVGAALAWAQTASLRLDAALIAGLAAMAIQIGTNLFNDAADFLNGTDRAGRIGPPRVTQRGWLSAAAVRRAAFAAFLLAALGGIYLVGLGGPPILGIGLLALLAGYGYSDGPWPISRGPWGEVMVIAFFGIAAVAGTAFLCGGGWSLPAVILGAVLGLPAAGVLLVNNTRDHDDDRLAGRRTLAIRLGPGKARTLYAGMLGLAFALLVTLGFVAPPMAGALLGLTCLPLAWRAARRFAQATTAADFADCLGRTAGLETALALTIGLGLAMLS